MNSKIEVFTPIRGIAAILVAFSHMNFIWERHSELTFLGNGNFSVIIFFMLSGFVLMYRYGNQITQRMSFGEYKGFIKKRVGKIYVLYMLTELVFFIFVVGGEVIHKGGGMEVFLKYVVQLLYTSTMLQSLAPFASICWVLNTTLWYISVLFVFYLLTPALIRGTNKVLKNNTVIKSVAAIISIFVLYCIAFWGLQAVNASLGQRFPDERVVMDFTTPYINIFYFILGMLICKLFLVCREKEIDKKIPQYVFSILEIVLGAVLLYFNFGFADRRFNTVAISLWLILISFQRGILSKILCKSKLLKFLGDISLHIYMVHYVYTVIYAYVYKMIFPDTEVYYIILIISLWLLIIPSAYIVYRIQNKHMGRKRSGNK